VNKKLKIWLVDDDPIFVFITKKLISDLQINCDVIVFSNGKTAYEALVETKNSRQDYPDLLFLDINMPIWDGWNFMEECRRVPGILPINICMVSSSNHPDDLERSKQYPCIKQYLIKPIQKVQIEETIRALVE
jgi:CheY-like chemotaxis protein